MTNFFDDLPSFRAAIPPQGALLGLDPGSKTIGVAIGDSARIIASPLTQVKRQSWAKDIAALRTLLHDNAIVGLVIGLPKEMDGFEGASAKAARRLGEKIFEDDPSPLPTLFWDERLSTSAVQRMMVDEMDLSRGKRKKAVDRAAAAYILQGVLDGL